MRIRALLPSDKESLLKLLDHSYEEVKKDANLGECLRLKRPSSGSQDKWFSEIRKLVNNGDAVVIVAGENGRVVGFCTIIKKDLPESEMSHIGVLGVRVAEGWRGQGIGTKMMKEALKKSNGKFETIELSVFRTNRNAQRLYERLGFRVWGMAPKYIKRGRRYFDTVYMSLKI